MVLFASLGRDRFVLFSSPRSYYLARVYVSPSCDAVIPPFSGKVSKSLLIKANSKLSSIFEGSNIKPKPIRVSPLAFNGTYLWVKAGKKHKHLTVVSKCKYFFYVGFDETIAHMVFEAFKNMNNIELFNTKWKLLDVTYFKEEIPSKTSKINLNNTEKIVVKLESPVNLIDPFKKTRYKRFIPLAGTVFAYNIGEISRILQRNTYYWQLINLTNTILQETANIWETVKKVFYIYEGKKIPGLAGTIEYKINKKILEKIRETKTLIENILTHAQIMGVGSGRANGFGHITVKTT